jgi:hypothetical protein
MQNDNEFKVVDRRASSGTADEPAAGRGPGFVMKDKTEAPPPGPDKVDFPTLVFSLATGALIHMGLAPDPATQRTEKNLDLARQNIEILTMLKEKTKGNLSEEEAKMLDNLLAEIQLRFVDATRGK